MHPLKWNYSLKINTDSFLMTASSPLSGWPSSADGQVAMAAYNQLHFARKKHGSGSFINPPRHGFPNFCLLWIALSEYAPDEAALKTLSLTVSRRCPCFAWGHIMLSPMISYQIARWRRGWSWPTNLKCFWMIWEILFPHLSLSEMFVCAMNIPAGMYHCAFPKSRFRNCQDQMQRDYFFHFFLGVSDGAWEKGQMKLKRGKFLHEAWEFTSWHFWLISERTKKTLGI